MPHPSSDSMHFIDKRACIYYFFSMCHFDCRLHCPMSTCLTSIGRPLKKRFPTPASLHLSACPLFFLALLCLLAPPSFPHSFVFSATFYPSRIHLFRTHLVSFSFFLSIRSQYALGFICYCAPYPLSWLVLYVLHVTSIHGLLLYVSLGETWHSSWSFCVYFCKKNLKVASCYLSESYPFRKGCRPHTL